MPHLEDYGLNIVNIPPSARTRTSSRRRISNSLKIPKSRRSSSSTPATRLVSRLMPSSIEALIQLVKTKRPDLIILTDDVYGTFIHGFRSLLGALPRNTIGVYSYSKYFGCTGWRLGVIALHQDNIIDQKIAAHPEAIKQVLDRRYGTLTLNPRERQVHRSYRRRQPRCRPQPYGWAFAAAAGDDDHVLAVRDDG